VVFTAGMNDRDQGLGAFLSALCTQPDVQLDPLLSTPDVQQVFAQAQQDAQGGACGPGAAPPAMIPPPGIEPTPSNLGPSASGPRDIDNECPPGVVCNSDGSTKGPTDFARFFFNLQFAAGFAWVAPGMKTDSGPPPGEIFVQREVVTDSSDDGFINEMDDIAPEDMNIDVAQRSFFNEASAWVPDADSFDDFERVDMATGRIEVPRGVTSLSSSCGADGTETGPMDLTDPITQEPIFAEMEPSSYCARVPKSGFVVNPALRLNAGYFLSDTFALSIPFRFQFDAGKGSLSHMLIGLRGELLFSEMESATGVPVSWFFGATYGQVQAKPPPKDPKRAAPFVISGPFGFHTGINVRIRIMRNFGFIVSPEVDVLLPDFLINADLSGGVEAAF